MSRVMDMNEADILAGRAKSVSARHYALYELDRLTDAYHHAWEKLGIVISCSSASLSDLYNQVIDKSALAKENPNSSFVNNNEAKTWLLNASLKISKGTTFYINSTDTKWLKIISDGTSSPSLALAKPHRCVWQLQS